MTLKNTLMRITILLFVLLISIYIGCSNDRNGDVRLLPPIFCPLGYIEISNRAQLEAIANDLDASYCLVNDINLGGVDWSPLGTFLGNFDGNNLSIMGLRINAPTLEDIALFSRIGYEGNSVGLVKNLVIVSPSIVGGTYVAALVGLNYSSIENVHVEGGSVSGALNVGGLAGGNNTGGSILQSSSSAAVGSSGNNIGGLVGFVASTGLSIDKSYARGSVTGDDFVGGLVGYLLGSIISNSYASGSVTGDDRVGSLVGGFSASGTILNTYGEGMVTGNTNTAGLVGSATGLTITNSLYDKLSTGQSIGHNGVLGGGTSPVGVTAAANIELILGSYYDNMGNGDTNDDVQIFIGWNFSSIWRWSLNWPTLR